jgi:small GTP-binding protein
VNVHELDIAVYGIINAGKSSLINALAGRQARSTGPIGGTTVDVAGVEWRVVESEEHGLSLCLPLPLGEGRGEGRGTSSDPTGVMNPIATGGATPLTPGPSPMGRGEEENTRYTIRLIDTPGLEEVGDSTRSTLATDAAHKADLVLFVLSEDLTSTARRALVDLKEAGKPIVVALNKMDLLEPLEQDKVLQAVRNGLAGLIPSEDVVPISASPIVRRLVLLPGGGSRVEATRGEPEVEALETRLLTVLSESASDLKALAEAASRVESYVIIREADRAKLRLKAERVADETSAALAVAMAVNPLPLLDFLTGPGGLAILVRRVSEVYGERLSGEVVRGLARELIRGGRVVLWGSLATTIGGGAMKFLPGFGHLAGALTQGASAGYFGHVVGRALVEYLDSGHDWGDGGIVAALDRIAASTDRKAVTRGLIDRIKARLKGRP